jgi:hypothetical protein
MSSQQAARVAEIVQLQRLLDEIHLGGVEQPPRVLFAFGGLASFGGGNFLR